MTDDELIAILSTVEEQKFEVRPICTYRIHEMIRIFPPELKAEPISEEVIQALIEAFKKQ